MFQYMCIWFNDACITGARHTLPCWQAIINRYTFRNNRKSEKIFDVFDSSLNSQAFHFDKNIFLSQWVNISMIEFTRYITICISSYPTCINTIPSTIPSPISNCTIYHLASWNSNNSSSANITTHYCDVIMGTIASLITGVFPAPMAINAENVSIWWRHHADDIWD